MPILYVQPTGISGDFPLADTILFRHGSLAFSVFHTRCVRARNVSGPFCTETFRVCVYVGGGGESYVDESPIDRTVPCKPIRNI